jgi:hypothetical protein
MNKIDDISLEPLEYGKYYFIAIFKVVNKTTLNVIVRINNDGVGTGRIFGYDILDVCDEI